jgi:hypothetical protein
MANEVYIQSCERAAANLPASTSEALFTISDYIRVHRIVGVCTVEIQNQACTMKVTANPTTGTDTDLCVGIDIDSHTVGSLYTVMGDFSKMMITTDAVGAIETVENAMPFIVAPGTIDIDCSATNTGKIKWTLIWEPVAASASVVAA